MVVASSSDVRVAVTRSHSFPLPSPSQDFLMWFYALHEVALPACHRRAQLPTHGGAALPGQLAQLRPSLQWWTRLADQGPMHAFCRGGRWKWRGLMSRRGKQRRRVPLGQQRLRVVQLPLRRQELLPRLGELRRQLLLHLRTRRDLLRQLLLVRSHWYV